MAEGMLPLTTGYRNELASNVSTMPMHVILWKKAAFVDISGISKEGNMRSAKA